MKQELYSDGGVILKNPSKYGGTWAFASVEAFDDGTENLLNFNSGFVPAPEGRLITNNVSELIAAIKAFESIPDDWEGVFCCDSQVTIIRLFKFGAMRNVPTNVKDRALKQVNRLRLGVDKKIKFRLLAGHPTKQDMENGFKIKDNLRVPVSKWNKFCDDKCQQEAKKAKAKLGL